ncbi:Vesicle transport through interaction with t-SNAREs 1B [Perkinsus olseni]|nr:Vesicle transport through interaction with t-SNAREs 1B [Perkinsus olseni]
MGDLRGQREVMSRTRDHFNDLDEQLTMARRAIQNMGRRVMLNKAVLVAVCLILLVAIFYTVHKKVMDRAGTVAGPPPPPSAP